ncbi:MAG: hypothetical protein B6D61_06125 [Bacteroidetes bacterium 4484_249]|nr:MAG: hypothetical protein B6D61_06125 [Bacteroidetes bacterium 4484_249]
MDTYNNPQLKLAYDFVQYTGKNIFLTGKAGTGKTTFLHNLKKHSPKRMVVVAPTGVAAINAAGVTIHSFFQLSFGPQIPGYETAEIQGQEKKFQVKRFSKEKRNIIRSLDLLVIDEISMVRADLLDGIDSTLRRFRNRNIPFGGVQLLMIGDLQQLAPVVKEAEWSLLRKHYDTQFFFSSNALKQTQYVTIELKHVYRQKDEYFIGLLNKIRDNKIDGDVIEKLNARYKKDFDTDNTGYIILTTHNEKARRINDSRLRNLPGKIQTYEAEVDGLFPEYIYPTDFELELKKGAQVMFVKNDPNPAKEYFNGKIGTITKVFDDGVKVKCEGDEDTINVLPVEWQKMKYVIDDETKEIRETVEGTFKQLPLKLAWAITIHKSQGLTFKKAIIDAEAAFAHGQVYVALSRLQSLEGLVLSSQISKYSVKHDRTVESFTKYYEDNQPDGKKLEASKKDYQQTLLTDLFDFNTLQKNLYYIIKVVNENLSSLPTGIREQFLEISNNIRDKIADVAEKFRKQLIYLHSQKSDAEKNEDLQDRIKKASVYFAEQVKKTLQDKLDNINTETDNKAVSKSITGAVDRLQTEAIFKLACLNACKNGFVVKEYLNARAKASLEEQAPKPVRKKVAEIVSSDIEHPELYKLLKAWRDEKAEELDWEIYMVLPLKTMRELCYFLPASSKELKAIHGLGKKKLKMFGEELLEIIIAYREENNIKTSEYKEPEAVIKVPKKSSKRISFELWKKGKTVKEIAEERQYAVSTIEGHLATFISSGEIKVEELVSSDKLKMILEYFNKNETALLSEAKAAFGDDTTYSELRFVQQHLKYLKKTEGQ